MILSSASSDNVVVTEVYYLNMALALFNTGNYFPTANHVFHVLNQTALPSLAMGNLYSFYGFEPLLTSF